MIDRVFANKLVSQWIDVWNAHDLDSILSLYENLFEMFSPLIIERMVIESGVIKGKAAIRQYWSIGLSSEPLLRFELVKYYVGVSSIAMMYKSVGRRDVCEILHLGNDGLIVRGESHHE